MRLPWRRRRDVTGAGGLQPADALFVIGPARSGTTILQNALNDSPDVFLLGEPDLHLDDGAPGFAARYNAMHEGWANQPTKSSHLPPVLATDGPWYDHLDRLAGLHRRVGSKIVVNPGQGPEWRDRFLHFHCSRFYAARYLFVFRHPAAVLASTISFQRLVGDPAATAAAILANYARTVALFTHLLRVLPNVRATIHEDVDAALFASLAEWLGIPLDGGDAYYDVSRIRSRDEPALGAQDAHGLALLTTLFQDLRAELRAPSSRLQIEQNNANIDLSQQTMIGSIHHRATIIDRYLVYGPDPPQPGE